MKQDKLLKRIEQLEKEQKELKMVQKEFRKGLSLLYPLVVTLALLIMFG